MSRTRSWAQLILITTLAIVVGAQETDETEYRSVENPFGEEFSYTIGDELNPNVDIDGVRWNLLQLATRGDQEIVAGRPNPITVTVEFENRRYNNVDLLVILLLEDEDGNDLERIRCDPFGAAGGRIRVHREKVKVSGESLLATRKLYVFYEVF